MNAGFLLLKDGAGMIDEVDDSLLTGSGFSLTGLTSLRFNLGGAGSGESEANWTIYVLVSDGERSFRCKISTYCPRSITFALDCTSWRC